jgi:hypothetical protein
MANKEDITLAITENRIDDAAALIDKALKAIDQLEKKGELVAEKMVERIQLENVRYQIRAYKAEVENLRQKLIKRSFQEKDTTD